MRSKHEYTGVILTDIPIDIKRRHFLKVASTILVAGAAISLFPLSFITASRAINPQHLIAFQRLSATLTGNSQLSADLLQVFFDYLSQTEHQSLLNQLLEQVDTIKDSDQLHTYLSSEMQSSSATGELLKKITKIWYYGSDDNHTISASAYERSLLWHTFGATPRGVAGGMTWNLSPFKHE